MLENKFSSIPANFGEKTTLKIFLEVDPKFLKFFELPLTKLMNVRKQVLFNKLCEDKLKLFKNRDELILTRSMNVRKQVFFSVFDNKPLWKTTNNYLKIGLNFH